MILRKVPSKGFGGPPTTWKKHTLIFLRGVVSDDGTLEGTHFHQWSTLFVEASMKTGKDPRWPAKYTKWMTDAGFEGVTEKVSTTSNLPSYHKSPILRSKYLCTDLQVADKSLAEGRTDEGDWRLELGQHARRSRGFHLSTVHQSPRVDHGGGGSLPRRREEGLAKQEDPLLLENVSVAEIRHA